MICFYIQPLLHMKLAKHHIYKLQLIFRVSEGTFGEKDLMCLLQGYEQQNATDSLTFMQHQLHCLSADIAYQSAVKQCL